MKSNKIQYSDLELLIQLFSNKPATPYIFDPYNRLNFNDAQENLASEGDQILVNLGGKLIEYKGMPLNQFDLILDFGKAETKGFEAKTFHFIHQPEGHMRWLFQNNNLKSVLAFYNASGKRGKLLALGIRLLAKLRLRRVLTCGSVKILSKDKNKLESSIANSCDDYSIFMGTPGVQRSILVSLIQQNEVKQFLKIPTNEASSQLIQHEKEAILSLNSIASSYLITPAIYSTTNDNELLMENLQEHHSIRTAEFTAIHKAATAEILANQAQLTTIADSEFWTSAKSTLTASRFSAHPQLNKLAELGTNVIQFIDADTPILTHWAHGDFTPWNMVINDDKIALYDWELFRNQAPALFDLFHFHYQKGILMDHDRVNEIQEQIEKTLQSDILQNLIQSKEMDVRLYHRLYLLVTIAYFIQIFEQQSINLQNQWQIEAWIDALNREYKLLKSEGNYRKEFILDLNEALSTCKHAYLKFDYKSLADLPESADLDIAIEKKDIPKIVNFCKNSPLVKRINHHKKSFMSILEIHFLNGSFLSVDLIHQFKRKATIMLSAKDLLANRQLTKNGLMVPAVKHDLAYAFAFYTLNNAVIPLRYHQLFFIATAESKAEAVDYINTIYRTSFSSIAQLFTKGKDEKINLEKAVNSTSLSSKIVNGFNYLLDTVRDLIYKRGYLVTFSGVDGAGKSTIIEIVKENIEKKYRKEVVLLRHRPGILPILSALKHGKSEAEKIAGEVLPRQGRNKSSLSSALRFSYYYLDYLLGQVYVYFKYILKGKIVLYDRYYFDFINDAKRSNIYMNRNITKALYRFVMKPKLNIFLYAEAQTILARKQELNAADITEMTKNYQSLFSALKEKSKKARYTCIENDVLDQTVAAVLKEFELVA